MVKAILLDIDGTLTNDKKCITPKTKEALLAAQGNGVRLALASGRPDQGLYRWARELQMDKNHGIFICYNGARVVDCESGEVLFDQCLSMEEARAVLNHIRKFHVTPIIARGKYMHTDDVFGCVIDYKGKPLNLVQYESRGNNYLLCEEKDLAEWVQFPVEKILTAGDPAYLQAHYKEMEAPFAESLNCMFTADYYFEYTAQGVDKAKAIEAAFGKLGITKEEMMAFGDAQNDIGMLRFVRMGFAMANATDEVKEAAFAVTLDNNHDGIAAALKKYGIVEGNAMHVTDILEQVRQRTKEDEGFRRALLFTRQEKNSMSAFCRLCTQAGFPISVMDLLQEGEESYAAMRRSTNGGGENSPLLKGEDDLYEMFLVGIEG